MASRAQIKARALFAKRAKSGFFKRARTSGSSLVQRATKLMDQSDRAYLAGNKAKARKLTEKAGRLLDRASPQSRQPPRPLGSRQPSPD